MTKYNVIYADPPWHYPNGLPYETMSFEEINKLPLDLLTESNSICFLWATTPYLPQALETLKAWGFDYKTTITWVKTYANAKGSFFKINTEHLLVGVKGNIPSFQMKESNIYLSEPTAHSQKPDYFRSLVSKTAKKVFASPLKLELFARDIKGIEHEDIFKDWDVFGNQVQNTITLP